jgi:hypothetical protein
LTDSLNSPRELEPVAGVPEPLTSNRGYQVGIDRVRY